MDEKYFQLQFIQFVLGLQQGAWMSLGKIQNPLTGKIEKNLNHVMAIIDTLLMIKEKTKGNLSKEELHLLDNTLSQLQINYVEEVKKRETDMKEDQTKLSSEDNKLEENSKGNQ